MKEKKRILKDNQLILKRKGDIIEFCLQDDTTVGITNYRDDIWEEFNSVNWYVNLENLNSSKEKAYVYTGSRKFSNKRDLHVIVMIKWYGEKAVIEAHQEGYIVEHFDNVECNCMISNLAFVSNDLNLAKAHLYDKERVKYRNIVAVNFFKDFETQKYQATFGFNEEVEVLDKDTSIDAIKLKLVYPDDYRLLFNDLNSAIYSIIKERILNLDLLSFENKEITPTIKVVNLTEEELPMLIQDGDDWFFVVSDKAKIREIAPNQKLYGNKDKPKEN
ncbi:hypothetical protein QRY07_12080 [Bacillus cereus]|uniref:hypothetical protein n=1 Tax=Bacillus cereus TaxID=1396 RepID=UPI0025700A52|nr:hypothetical protein [Bacillus cereus]WJE22423.1 hypothetical protein QRY07_12080 [Bacillus cereus]